MQRISFENLLRSFMFLMSKRKHRHTSLEEFAPQIRDCFVPDSFLQVVLGSGMPAQRIKAAENLWSA